MYLAHIRPLYEIISPLGLQSGFVGGGQTIFKRSQSKMQMGNQVKCNYALRRNVRAEPVCGVNEINGLYAAAFAVLVEVQRLHKRPG
ncbi:TPA: hypothetical protein ACNV4U_003098 [Serratia marcescens]|uniref:hypothetical protein n=1 Tax=Serratia TaxID=613 RepID=UPI00111318C7|nr:MULTISPECIES: hypothetical protein [Serratia]EME9755210.1 hypothetical protein [Serratia marcescens]MDM3532965.1 hypothetical protein [Serratia marcescens]MDM3538169.1 hypothetical protein [Serratia marcescens]MDP8604452.1 hypothetical protein [Serratia marcescens]MDP8609538.1 hypothetical protein [Serratia marcescens]